MIQLHNSPSDSQASDVVSFVIAQYTADPFRREARNVGVIVRKSGETATKFVGQKDGATWDASSLRFLDKPSVYKLWVDSWKKKSATLPLGELVKSGSENFHLVDGGDVSDTGFDSCEEVCAYLFSLLVSTKGLAAALEETQEAPPLKNDLLSVFRSLGLLEGASKFPFPIRNGGDLRGKTSWQRIAMLQEGANECWAMDTVDFTQESQTRARDRAAYIRCVFDDIATETHKGKPINPTVIVRMVSEDVRNEDIAKGVGLIRDRFPVINWLNSSERKAFLWDRESIATSGSVDRNRPF